MLSNKPKFTLGWGIKYFSLAVDKNFDFLLKLSNPIFDRPKIPDTNNKSPFLAPVRETKAPFCVSPKIDMVIFI